MTVRQSWRLFKHEITKNNKCETNEDACTSSCAGHTFGVKSSVTYTEFEFSSDIANGGCNSVCKYLNPWAIPMAIFIRLSQDNWPPSPSKQKNIHNEIEIH
jgi:hypothetical protein